MRSERLNELAIERYAKALRDGTATPYDCFRFFERSFQYHGDDADVLALKEQLAGLSA